MRAVSPDAEMLYMHPVKAQSDIRLALEKYGIRVIAIDHEDEIAKLTRVVRALDIDPGSRSASSCASRPKGQAAYELSKKFGAGPASAVELAERLHRTGYKVGLCFHVGSQIEDPDTYERALASADWVRNRLTFELAGLDVGGGFPAEYGHDPNRKQVEMPSLGQLMSRLSGDLKEYGFDQMPLVAEPGRVIVARCLSLIVRVLLRKGRRLYINDGIWASLSDSWTGKITLPARFIPDPAIRSRNGQREEHRAVQGVRRDLRFGRHPVAAVLAAGDGRHRRLDRDRPYRRLFAVAQNPLQRLLSRHLRRGHHALRRRRHAAGFCEFGDDGGLNNRAAITLEFRRGRYICGG